MVDSPSSARSTGFPVPLRIFFAREDLSALYLLLPPPNPLVNENTPGRDRLQFGGPSVYRPPRAPIEGSRRSRLARSERSVRGGLRQVRRASMSRTTPLRPARATRDPQALGFTSTTELRWQIRVRPPPPPRTSSVPLRFI